jgi:hypothetical protein
MGMDAIRNYEYSSAGGGVGEISAAKPIHNWASHGADALKYVALWCGRDLEFILESKRTYAEKRKLEAIQIQRKRDAYNNVGRLIEEWRAERDAEYEGW